MNAFVTSNDDKRDLPQNSVKKELLAIWSSFSIYTFKRNEMEYFSFLLIPFDVKDLY